MPVVVVVVAAFAAVVVAGAAFYRLHRLRRALVAERAARRLTDGMQRRDVAALHRRIQELLRDRAVVEEAERVLDAALAHYSNQEGGQP